ncbi:TPA: hypothetical protein U0Z15_002302 [Listeria monocytogenes]|uniref:Uncharacterized protein n=4 Tax=root TaxID=1 RepID=A0A059T6C9_9CAUD|nr:MULTISPECIES: hypothetical protein [Listeria]YP_009044662.1 hypothetical protein LP030-3_016 [Listeria phage LP-030-3]YP_009204895.1 hypothetical protein AVV22_gp52 [Listeria phage vB_LmoS_188]YP_009210511.1 hypothetical protein AVV21_gp63 [Listeria phage vB_LmoS_293]AHL18722.1 hypothetical protein LP030-3_016 [Listeria phage LP-030-3]AJE28057.1 hypothetical protein SE24_052 [Listeria phage vB_LmoS_188]AJE28128.1 hypothetical protein SE25_063 [Listeria phage vB_LmoS_293]EAA0093697.1 hypot
MTSTIKISEKDKVFQIATKSGWAVKVGMQVTIDGIDFAIYPFYAKSNVFIQVSEVESGGVLINFPVDFIDVFVLDTRDKAIEYYKDNVIPLVQKKIEVNGLDEFRKAIKNAKNYILENFGERPQIKKFEEANE